MIATMDTVESGIPRIPVGEWIEKGFDWLLDHASGFFDGLADLIEDATRTLTDGLQWPPAVVTVLVMALLAWASRNWRVAIGAAAILMLVIGMDQWDNAMLTLSVVLIASAVALLIGVPVGIAAARWSRVSSVVRPVLDLMQTMPAFVWLVPVVMLFGIGVPAGLVATVIFALPPGVRLTELGIRQVDPEIVEAGQSFGGTPRQILGGIQLPLAMPTVMAGVNQVIMLALSMAVIAGMVGGGGLGGAVMTAITSLDVGLGFEAGLSVVMVAIYLDRVTAGVGQRGRRTKRRVAVNSPAEDDKEQDEELSELSNQTNEN